VNGNRLKEKRKNEKGNRVHGKNEKGAERSRNSISKSIGGDEETSR